MGILIHGRIKVKAVSRFKKKDTNKDEVEVDKTIGVGMKGEINIQGTWRRRRPIMAWNEVEGVNC